MSRRAKDRAIVYIVVIAVGLGVAAIAGAFSSHSDPAPCGIVSSGQRLCGNDLASYCREFAEGSLDQGTVESCSSVNVDVVR